MKLLLLLLAFLISTKALYSDSSPVISLTASSFDSKIQKGGYWIVEFYAPWCGHCQKLQPEYEKAAKGLTGAVTVAAVDCDVHKGLASQHGVQGFPTIKLFYTDTKGSLTSTNYNGGRTANEIISWALDQVKKLAMARIGSKLGGEKKQKQKQKQKTGGSGFYPADGDVINLGDQDFQERVQNGEDLWMMEFYAPWCGHCKNLKSDWQEAAKELKGKVKVGAVDCTAHERICGEFGVQGFPTLKFFGKDKSSPEDYQGSRDSASIVAFALERWSKMAPPPVVKELTEVFIFEKHCLGDDEESSKQLCLMAFLPHILDSRADGRRRYLEILHRLAGRYRERPYGYLWIEGGKQAPLEANFGVGGFGYPAVVMFSPKKMAYALLKSGMDDDHLVEFVDGLRHGFEKVIPIEGELANVETTIPWDGKDAAEEAQDEFDLDEIMKEEL